MEADPLKEALWIERQIRRSEEIRLPAKDSDKAMRNHVNQLNTIKALTTERGRAFWEWLTANRP